MKESVHQLFSLIPPVSKPGGGEFKFWRNETVFTKTYHVSGESPQASDGNPGTESQPFKTINHAAGIVRPGECVFVHPGIYRECIRPAAGGLSPSAMIGFHAVPGGKVIVKGSESVGRQWTCEAAAKGIWVLDLYSISFGNYNPFSLDNLPDSSFDMMDWAQPHRGKLPYTLPRGMVFQDGRRLQCVASHAELLNVAGSHWTDRSSAKLFIHPLGGKDPNELLMEITTRRACLRPRTRGLGFIQVRGFVFEQVGNGFSRPQEGAVSVCAGHHWLIEENTVREVNGIGIDIGNGWYGEPVEPPEPGVGEPDWNIVRRNHISDTGVCGIAGLPCNNALIEENTLTNNSRFPIAEVSESAGIKTHGNHATLIRRNFITDNPINGIWMDWDNRDSRCTQNVMLNCGTGIFIEASIMAPFCILDRNIIWGAKQGIYEHDCIHQVFAHNFIGQSELGLFLAGKVTDRIIADHVAAGGGHTASNNIFFEVGQPIKESQHADSPLNVLSDNISEAQDMTASLHLEKLVLTLNLKSSLAVNCAMPLVSHDISDHPRPAPDCSQDPMPEMREHSVAIHLDRWTNREQSGTVL